MGILDCTPRYGRSDHIPIQCCTAHKLRNLLSRATAHLREEMAEDYRRMIYSKSREAAENAQRGFLKKWRLRCTVVAASLEEVGKSCSPS